MRFRKYFAEFLGTGALVVMGCGTAMLLGCDASFSSGYILTALAFGLCIVALAYSIGNISGCHVNPAVSLGVLMNKGMSAIDFLGYVIAQILGACCGTGALYIVFRLAGLYDMTGYFGSNTLIGVNGSIGAGFLVEMGLTFLFVLTVLGVTDNKFSHGSFGGLVIGLSLTLVHILGIGLTGTSVNPARSIGPAIFALLTGYTYPITVLWIFIIAPMVGAALAALTYATLSPAKKEPSVIHPAKKKK